MILNRIYPSPRERSTKSALTGEIDAHAMLAESRNRSVTFCAVTGNTPV